MGKLRAFQFIGNQRSTAKFNGSAEAIELRGQGSIMHSSE